MHSAPRPRPRLLATMITLSGATLALGCAYAETPDASRPREPVVGLPCEGCEDVFLGLPERLSATSRIAPENEPGEPLTIEGVVRDRAGQPAPGVIVYAYQTDAGGIYPQDDRPAGQRSRHGRLRGWALTGADGRYRFDTIRPGGYPGTDIAQHVHMHLVEVGRCTYYVDDIHFDDDPRLTPAQRARLGVGRGGVGVVMPRREPNGRWQVTRDLWLGENIPGAEACVASTGAKATGSAGASATPLPDPLAAGWRGEPTCELLQENERLRALRCTFPPGVGHERHAHAPHFGYALSGGRMRIDDARGVREVELATGSSFTSEGGEHEVVNVGETTVAYVIVEPRAAATP